MKTSIVIFATNQEKAERKLNEILEGKEYFIIKRTKNTVETNSEFYRAFKWSNGSFRTVKAHELYVDTMLDHDEFKGGMLPLLSRGNHDNDSGENYNWKNHVHYFFYR